MFAGNNLRLPVAVLSGLSILRIRSEFWLSYARFTVALLVFARLHFSPKGTLIRNKDGEVQAVGMHAHPQHS